MKKILLEKKINVLTLIIAMAFTAAVSVPFASGRGGSPGLTENTVGAESTEDTKSAASSGEEGWEELYNLASKDAMTIEEEEILPVLAISKEEDLVRWNDEGKVLILTFHRYPESYVPGQKAVTEFGQVWVTSLPEMEAWFAENYGDGTTPKEGWTARFEMLLGMPADGSHTHFSALWADPEDLTRPAYNPDAADDQVLVQLPEDVDEEYKQWFDQNIIWSYFDSWYPWTRLGYTYDYADNGTEYGLSEFLVNQNSTVDVEFTYTVDEMVEYLKGIK